MDVLIVDLYNFWVINLYKKLVIQNFDTWINTSICGLGASWDEENWRAQYGQVIESGEEPMPKFEVVDLWDWEKVTGTRKDGKGEVVRLVGRLVRRSVKRHPSMPSGGGLLKTAPICEVHLDLVRVTSGLHLPLFI